MISTTTRSTDTRHRTDPTDLRPYGNGHVRGRCAPVLLTGLLLTGLLLAGCTTGAPQAGTVRVISDEPIEPATSPADSTSAGDTQVDMEPADDDAAADEDEEVYADDGFDPEAGEVADPEGVVVETEEVRPALESAIAAAAEGVRLYRAQEWEPALDALRSARILLLDADLPEVMEEQGLAVLGCTLGPELGSVDLEAILEELEVLAGHTDDLEEHELIEREARRILARFGSRPSQKYLDEFVDQVQSYVDFYRGRHREFFEAAYRRKHKYWPTIRSVFDAKRLPEELGYMALVESGFKPRARSHANARGLWQFIPSTGRVYGLRRTDDFYDVEKATEAASEYLLDLISIFGSDSFLLAMSAYNAGEGRIQRCLRGIDDPFAQREFWEIQPCLARETREYVPRILAAAIIGTDPKRFGFDLPSDEEMASSFDVVTIPERRDLGAIAREAGVTVAQIRTHNTDLSSSATTTPVRNFPLYLPKGHGGTLIAELSATPNTDAPSSELTLAEAVRDGAPVHIVQDQDGGAPEVRGQAQEVVVRRGDTLIEIGRRHGVTVADLKRWNPFLNRRVLYRGDRLTLYGGSQTTTAASTYRVRRGDTLSEIARRHGTSIPAIAQANGLRSPYRLQIGQRLSIPGGGGARGGTTDARSRITFTVKPRNTLYTIARLFEVRYRDIMRWNDMSSSNLRVGQRLVIHPGRPFQEETYTVRRGDTVGKIARRFGVSVASVWTANGLTPRSVIRPGQRLTVYRPG